MENQTWRLTELWYQQVLGWINRYSGVGGSNPNAIALEDTVNPVVDLNP